MNYDIPKLPQPQYIIERPFAKIAKEDCATNDFTKQPPPEAGDWGGFIVTTSPGTAASGTSLSTVQTQQLPYFVPREGVIPGYILEMHRTARNFEQVVNPTRKSR